MKKNYIILFVLLFVSNFYFSQTYTLNAGSNGSTISTCSGTFVDDGGSAGQYTNNQNRTITFCPATAGDVIKVTFTVLDLRTDVLGNCQDVFDVYQGDAAYAAPLITAGTPDDRFCGTYTGASLPSVTSTNANGCITFNFIADATQRAAGWVATVSCGKPCKSPFAALTNSTTLNFCSAAALNPSATSVTFNGSASTIGAYGGGSTITINSYNWNFGDGTTLSTSTPTVSHTFPTTAGVYVTRLTVNDNNPISASGCLSSNSAAKVINVMPAPSFTASTPSPVNIACGASTTLTGVAKSQTKNQALPSVVGTTVALPDGTGGSFISGADFTGLFASTATLSPGCYPTLYFTLEHSWTSDLTIDLIAPSGETVRVFNQFGDAATPIYMFGSCVNNADDGVPGCGATYSVVNSGGQSWTNYGNAAITTTTSTPCAGYAGPCYAATTTFALYKPTSYNSANSFSALDGATMSGIWKIRIYDNQALDDGYLFSWGLSFPSSCYAPLQTITPDLPPGPGTGIWANGGAGPAVPGGQSTATLAVTDPGPDPCPTAGTCLGTQLTNSIVVGAFPTAGTYPYLFNVTDAYSCQYSNTVNVVVSCPCPTITSITYAGPYCNTAGVTGAPVISGTATAGGTYSSTPAGLTINAATGVITPTSSTAGTYTVTYFIAAAVPCAAASRTTAVVISPTPTTAASASGTISCTTPTINLNSTLAGVNYTWTAPAGGVLGSANSQSTTASGAGGTYTLNVQSAAGCTYSTTTSVTQNTVIPTGVSAGTNQTMTCASPSITLNGSVATPTNATASWNGANVCGTATNFTTSVCAAGVYTLTATNPASGCTLTSTVQVFPSAGAPSVTVSPVTNTLTCLTTTMNISVATTVATPSYTWSGGGITAGNGTGTITVNQSGTYNYTVTNTGNMCTTTGTIGVTQNTTAPTTTASTTGMLTCSTTTVALNSTLAGMNYTWTAPAGGTLGSANSQSTTASGAPGIYSLTVVNPVNSCPYTTTTSVTQDITQPITIPTSSGTLTCDPTNTVTVNSNLAGMNYTWTAPAGGSVASANSSVTAVTGAGVYSLTIVNPANGCNYSDVVTVSENTITPTVTVSTTGLLTCAPSSSVSLNGATTPATATVIWSGPNVCGTATSYTSSACASGIYTITVTDPANLCVKTETVQVLPNAAAPTVTLSVTSATVDCINTSQTVTATTTPSTDMIFSWSPAPSSGATSSVATFTAQGNYTCTATNTVTSCFVTAVVAITANTNVPTTVPVVTGALTCDPTSTVSLDANLAGMTYTWTAPAGGSVASANASVTTVTGAGTYSLVVGDPSSGCTYNTTASVTQNTTAPTVTVSTTGLLTCAASSSVSLNGATTPATATVIWTGVSVCGTATSYTSAACAAGIYTITVTDPANMCTKTETVQVLPNAGAPTVTLSTTSGTIDCITTSQTVTVTTTPTADITYAWSPTPVSGATAAIATFTAQGNYTCTVTNTLTSCPTTTIYAVTANTTVPVISISNTQTITCANPTAVISTTVVPAVTYTWTGTLVSGQGTGAVTVNQAGNYSVTVTSANGCTNTAMAQIIPGGVLPVATITATSTNSIITCQNPTVSLLANVTPPATYSYTWTGGGNNATNNVTTSGMYTVSVLNSVTGCSTIATYSVGSNTAIPSLPTTNTTIACGSNSVNVNVNSNAASPSYTWTTIVGSIVSGSGSANMVAGSAGQYFVGVLDNANGCVNTGTVTVTSSNINVAFTANPTSGNAPLAVGFTNQSTTGATYSWNFGDNSATSSAINPSHTYNSTGTYTAVLTATLGACTGQFGVTIEVFETATVIVPNVFSPNGDGVNDEFKLITTGIKDMTFDIYNRWGLKVHSLSTPSDSWSGKVNTGGEASDGNYFYVMKAVGFDGTEFKQEGYITIVR